MEEFAGPTRRASLTEHDRALRERVGSRRAEGHAPVDRPMGTGYAPPAYRPN